MTRGFLTTINSGIDAVKLPNGTLVLAYNPRENILGMTKRRKNAYYIIIFRR